MAFEGKLTYLSLGEVRDITNIDGTCSLRCVIDSEGNEERTVNYTSPFGSAGGAAGFIGVPGVGTRILLARIEDEWYYVSSYLAAPKPTAVTESGEIGPEPTSDVAPVAPELPRDQQSNAIVNLGGRSGNRVILYDEMDDTFINRGVRIVSAANKAIFLNDSPGVNATIIQNEDLDHIILTGGPDITGPEGRASDSLSDNMVEIETLGDQRYISHAGDILVDINDGGDILLNNDSVGSQTLSDDEDARNEFGNINIQSRYRDLNLFTGGDGETPLAGGTEEDPNIQSGRIFIESLHPQGKNQLIQIDTRGQENCTVRIISNKVDVSAGPEGLDIISKGSINIVAENDINMKSNTGSINIQADGNINADSSEIWLNSDKSEEATTNIERANSFYGASGVGPWSAPIVASE